MSLLKHTAVIDNGFGPDFVIFHNGRVYSFAGARPLSNEQDFLDRSYEFHSDTEEKFLDMHYDAKVRG